ncbi:MAG: phage terminase large subunit [Flavobacteriales bacterium]|nr:phage terminase large subunit [Flavobacteriales bacterium]
MGRFIDDKRHLSLWKSWGPKVADLPPELTGSNGFKNFLYLAWKAIGLPAPTPVQYDIADFMQHGGGLSFDRLVVEGFRGVGKSYIAAAFVVWVLLLDPSKIIQVVSGSKVRADDFTSFTLQLIEALGDLTAHLVPRDDQRASRVAFDVGCAPNAKDPSVTSKGLFSQLTGGRADLIIPDDIVTKQNSLTPVMRAKIKDAAEEFNAILKPNGRIIYLMTPQSEEDLAHELPQMGYDVRIWPVEIPSQKVVRSQGSKLAPMIREMIEAGVPVGTPTDPLRFDEEDLEKRRMGFGRTGYAMQFLLDQSLADAERFPLKINDLIVDDLDRAVTYEKLVWSNDPDCRIAEIPCAGFNGDYWHRPMQRVGQAVPYTGVAMTIDPSGRGKDETAYAVAACYGGQVFILEAGGLQGGYGDEVLSRLAEIAKRNAVTKIVIEENFGQGMFASLLQPHLRKIHPCAVEEIRHNRQKEARICDVLEPLMNAHKLIIDRKVLILDWETVKDYAPEDQRNYLLAYQISRITREKGALRHDDRIDALAMVCQYWVDFMAQDTDRKMIELRDDQQRRAIERFLRKAIGGPKEPPRQEWNNPRPGFAQGTFV